MIHFEIIKSPDPNVVANFKFHRNEVYLGSSSGDLIVRDVGISKSHIMLEVVEGELLIHPQKDIPYFLINGKRATSIRKIKAQDVIAIGQTEIKILGFSFTEIRSKKTILNEKLKILMDTNSVKLPVIEKLSEMMK